MRWNVLTGTAVRTHSVWLTRVEKMAGHRRDAGGGSLQRLVLGAVLLAMAFSIVLLMMSAFPAFGP